MKIKLEFATIAIPINYNSLLKVLNQIKYATIFKQLSNAELGYYLMTCTHATDNRFLLRKSVNFKGTMQNPLKGYHHNRKKPRKKRIFYLERGTDNNQKESGAEKNSQEAFRSILCKRRSTLTAYILK